MFTTIVIISDTAFADNSSDLAADTLKPAIPSDYGTVEVKYVPDSVDEIQEAVKSARAVSQGGVVLCSGGTGFSPRDVTPEALAEIIEKKASGIVQAMLAKSLAITPYAALARPVAGTVGRAIVVALPGKPTAARENFEAVRDVLLHGVKLLNGESSRALHASSSSKPVEHHCHHHHHQHHGGHGPTFHELITNDPRLPVSQRSRSSPFPMISVAEAEQIVLSRAVQSQNWAKEISVRPSHGLGKGIERDMYAQVDVPSFRASIVDGYAIVHTDGPGDYKVVGAAQAGGDGTQQQLNVQPGTTVRITTGAPVPEGATAVVPVEETAVLSLDDAGEELVVTILAIGVQAGDNIREIGSDIRKDTLIAKAGDTLTPGLIGALSSVGELYETSRPTIAILSTGDELIDPQDYSSEKHGHGRGFIFDSNRPTIESILRQYGHECSDEGILPDDRAVVASRLQELSRKFSVVITTGGVSMGEHDYLKSVIERDLQGTIEFGRVAMKPGKPSTFATLRSHQQPPQKATTTPGTLFFALPGNPASAVVGMHLFVLPALKALGGTPATPAKRITVKLGHDIRLDSRPEFHRANVNVRDGELWATSTGAQRSSMVKSFVGANALLELPCSTAASTTLPSGSIVKAIMIDSL